MYAAEKLINTRGRAGEVRVLFEIAKILEWDVSLEKMISPLLKSIAERLGLQYVEIALVSRSSGDILVEAAYGVAPVQSRGSGAPGRLDLAALNEVANSGEPLAIEKGSQSQLLSRGKKNGNVGDEFSFFCVPVKAGSEVAGTLSATILYNSENNLDELVRLLTVISCMVAQAVRSLRSAFEDRERLEEENSRLKLELKSRFRPNNIIGNSREMQSVYDQIAQVSKSSATVLILGETGTGKELAAHAIHYNSDRADRPFVRVHGAALAENLIESELFGHRKGAFTGAIDDRKGRFEMAHTGTLFLDEIGEIPLSIQTKLLRVLQEREFERVGDTRTIKVNVRLITATNRDLNQLAAEGRFREDLLYRLNVFPLFLPPLRNRRADIALLSDHFLEKYVAEYSKSVKRLSSAAIDMLHAYHWPGNVRELENVIERAVLVAEGEVIYPHHMPPTLQTAEASAAEPCGSLKEMVGAYERDIIVDTLKSARGNMAAAARALDTTQRIFAYKVSCHGIDPKRYAGG